MAAAVPKPGAWPIRLAVAGMVVLAMVLVASVLIPLSWLGTRQILVDTAGVTARDAAQIAAERSRRMIEPGFAALRTLAFDPIASAAAPEDRLGRVKSLAAELVANPLVSAIYVGYENGDFLLIRPLDRRDIRRQFQSPPSANYLVQAVTAAADGTRHGVFDFYGAQNDLILRRPVETYRFDPRERPWYAAANETVETVISGPYLFYSTGQVGISLSRLAPNGRTIVGLDMALDDLGESLGDLRMTPGAELALVDPRGAVMAYRDMRLLDQSAQAPGNVGLPALDDLGVEALSRLRQVARDGQPVSYRAAGREWLGVMTPFDGIDGVDLRLLVAAPADELLGDLARGRTRLILIAIGLILLTLPLGWWAGSRIGRGLERLTAQAQRMSRFDFSRPAPEPALLREVGELDAVMDNVSATVEAFLSVSRVLGTEPRIETMLAQVLEKLVTATRCDGGAVYLWRDDRNDMLRVAAFGDQGELQETIPCPADGIPREGCGRAEGARRRTEFGLYGRKGTLEGMLVLLHAADRDHEAPEFLAFSQRLTGMLAVAIETRQLIDAQKALFDAVIRVLADAIDAKSPYTGGHCERVPELTIMLADRMTGETGGRYATFRLDEEERYAFYLAAWLHDCGKITSPEHIVDKATKLEVIYNRIHEIRMRFEVLWRDAEIDCLRAQLSGRDATACAAARDARQAALRDDFRFVAECNVGGEFLADEAVGRLQAIAQATWQRHFDDELGLSGEEKRRLSASRGPAPALPATEKLLADRPDHLVPWGTRQPPVERGAPGNAYGFDMRLPAHRQNMGELHNLAVRRGTLTEEDRFAVNDHIVQTLIMLKQLPWPRHLERVPDIAANHHEKMDGTGYPRRLRADQLPITDRIMALADVFEALTAGDRPYKSAKTLSESLRIMAFMSKDRHLDAGLFLYFLHSGTWLDYARRYMQPSQIDDVDVDALARIAQAVPA